MPATAGRVRMPANNRVHSSAALQTHGIWQSAIKYDPYAPNKEDSKANSANAEPEGENPYTSFQGLMTLARISSFNPDESRGACKRCGRVGHLSFQCRNFLSVKEDKEKDQDLMKVPVLSGLEKIKGNGKIYEESEEEEESETSDSEVDSDIERIIAERYGKKNSSKLRSWRRKDVSDEDESDSDSGVRKRGRSKKRRSKKRDNNHSESEDEDKSKRRKMEKRRKRDESSLEEEEERHCHKRKSRKEKRRRRSHRYFDDSDTDASEDSGRRIRRKSRKAASSSESDVSDSDDSRIGRGAKRTEKRGQKRHHE